MADTPRYGNSVGGGTGIPIEDLLLIKEIFDEEEKDDGIDEESFVGGL